MQKLEVRAVNKFCWFRLQGLSLLAYGPGQGQMVREDSKKMVKLRIPLQDIQSLMDFSSIFLIVAWIHLQPWHLLCSGTVTSTVCLPWAWRNNPFYLCWTCHWLVSSGAFQYLFWKRQGISILYLSSPYCLWILWRLSLLSPISSFSTWGFLACSVINCLKECFKDKCKSISFRSFFFLIQDRSCW